MLYGIKLFTNRVYHTHHNNQHKHSLRQLRGKEKINMKSTNNKTLVDTNDILWTFEYDMYDNSVVVVSDRAVTGGYAVLSQYSMDNALGHDIPDTIVDSAMDMVAHDLPRRAALDYIIDEYAVAKQVRA